MQFKINGSWMKSCGRGDADTVVDVVQVLGYMPNGVDRMYGVRMPDGSLWTVSDWRGHVVEEVKPQQTPVTTEMLAALRACEAELAAEGYNDAHGLLPRVRAAIAGATIETTAEFMVRVGRAQFDEIR